MSLEPLEKLRLLGFTFWEEVNDQTCSQKEKVPSLLSISKNHLIYINSHGHIKETTATFLRQLSIALGGEGEFEEVSKKNMNKLNSKNLIVFGESKQLNQNFIEKFHNFYTFSSIDEILEKGSLKKNIWSQIAQY